MRSPGSRCIRNRHPDCRPSTQVPLLVSRNTRPAERKMAARGYGLLPARRSRLAAIFACRGARVEANNLFPNCLIMAKNPVQALTCGCRAELIGCRMFVKGTSPCSLTPTVNPDRQERCFVCECRTIGRRRVGMAGAPGSGEPFCTSRAWPTGRPVDVGADLPRGPAEEHPRKDAC